MTFANITSSALFVSSDRSCPKTHLNQSLTTVKATSVSEASLRDFTQTQKILTLFIEDSDKLKLKLRECCFPNYNEGIFR